MIDGDGSAFRSIDANCWCAATRNAECLNADVDIQVLSTVPGIGFNYWAQPEDALEVAKFINDDMAAVVKASPQCFVALGTVPMQSPQLAIQEMRRCVLELGMPGIQIGTHVNDWNLDAPELDPFWAAVAELDACVFVHPWDMQSGPRYCRHWFPWLLDMPHETSMAIASMLMGGVYDRYPNLRVCFAHGGGSICNLLGRIEHGFNARPDLCQTVTKTSPRDGLRKIWVDSLVHDPDILRVLMKKIGYDRIILGSDYPFPLGEVPRPGALIESCTWSSNPDEDTKLKRQMLSGNAIEFLNLSHYRE